MTIIKERDQYLDRFIENALYEDIGDGDHTSLASIPVAQHGKAELLIKEDGILAGMEIAEKVFAKVDNKLVFTPVLKDGDKIKFGDIAFTVEGSVLSILQSERLVLNLMQRMSGIASNTYKYTQQLKGLKTKILDTRKTTPGMRILEKEAVRIGGGVNHRMGLFDMILLKDNHIDFAGSIEKAIETTKVYLKKHGKDLKIEVEARSIEDVKRIINYGGVDFILLDNFSIEDTKKAVKLINGKFKTESSGKITIKNLCEYAKCGVDFISIGALTHQIKSLDMSLKAKF